MDEKVWCEDYNSNTLTPRPDPELGIFTWHLVATQKEIWSQALEKSRACRKGRGCRKRIINFNYE
ncbi:hypothetical protein RSJ42_00955 [Methanosarcina hadiensis]|uniref:hypothetical protein n=1 Tax=Methanosarcina hadiensis TaxID=3078083 RepID=UPI0039772ABC